ncbi:alpha/beta hydrolase [Catenovulum sp. SM1970]|uniref:alpha/beta hydrolase family protein n=1 Tax=Marinifaba aquimaris TaxID=2741323 RepID=UPI001571F291|nr:alpha/beta hydrolase [Marinifaba aquimaris]NTS77512.1 alpha/beta hydrolase [Marinifaba aquimaris]
MLVKTIKGLGLVILLLFVLLLLLDETSGEYVDIEFSAAGNQLSGVMVLPENPDIQAGKDMPIVIFVHGDGALNADTYGYYRPIFSALAERGIASLSWSKAGVEGSSGNWLAQSMQDRAEEVKSAIQYIQQQGYSTKRIGVLGFSQAGWVIPYLADEPNIDFITLVGGAINWRTQSQYLIKQRLLSSGQIKPGEPDVANAIAEYEQLQYQAIALGFDGYQSAAVHQHPFAGEPITDKARFNFVSRNIDEDARKGLANLTVPMLALFGDHDLNVDIEQSQAVYQQIFNQNPQATLTQKVIKNATHGLLRDDIFLHLDDIEWLIKFEWHGKDAFAPGALLTLTDWIAQQANQAQ